MTELQHLHHSEQMEALRSEFQKYWREVLEPKLACVPEKDRYAIMQGAWNKWRTTRVAATTG